MNRKVILTQDGSSTLEIEGWDEHYHSTHGAITEAYHVFIHNGLALFEGKEIHLLEIFFIRYTYLLVEHSKSSLIPFL